jgi:glycosyltransferase involved in cell wall biosynthesis
MRILIITQKADKNDDLLGFMYKWIERLAQQCQSVIVICLAKGETDWPLNVKVLSLGKEQKISRFQYIRRFFKYVWRERRNYDLVFVHMNQEYICLAGFIWKILGKKIVFWRNHPLGNFFTKVAVSMADKVFCVSEFAFVARYKKTNLMPAGIDTDLFKKKLEIEKVPRSLLYLGRISPIKKIDILIDALKNLNRKNIKFKAEIFGNFSAGNKEYFFGLRQKAGVTAQWHEGVAFLDAPDIYNRYEIFINLTPTGSFDKTTLEAMACETLVLVSNRSFAGKIDSRFIFLENNADDLVRKIESLFSLTGQTKAYLGRQLRDFVIKNHSLNELIGKLMHEFKNL